MTRTWTDADGRTWEVSAAAPAVEGGPYLVEFVGEDRSHRVEYAGERPPEGLSGDDLEILLRQATD